MKYILSISLILFIWISSFSQTITIEKFENDTIDKFDLVNGVSNEITRKDIKDGFTIQILNYSNIENVQQKNSINKFTNIKNPKSTTNSKIYDVKEPETENNKTVHIRITKGQEHRTITLIITDNDTPTGIIDNSSPCDLKEPTNNCEVLMDYEHNFGEHVKFYDKRTIVYIYDFNKDSSKRGFYKIEAEADSDSDSDSDKLKLKKSIANFNRETLTPKKNVKIKIVNINKFMYNVAVADTVINFSSEPSELFNKLFIGNDALLGSLISTFSEKTIAESNYKGIEAIREEVNCFVKDYNWLNNKALEAYDPCFSFPCCYKIEYTELANKLARIKGKAIELKAQLIKENIDQSEINVLIENLPSDQELKKIIVFLRNMVAQNQVHTADYIPLNGNILDLKISITPKDSIFKYFSIPEYKIKPILIQIPIIWKPFASFSSGSFFALGKYLQNKTYSWQPIIINNNIVDSSRYALVESGYTLPPIGFCAFGNIEWKVSRSFGIGASVGVGLTIEKSPRLAYLAGASLFFGDLHQFAITGGIAAMQVNKLTNSFQTISENKIVYDYKPSIEYYKELKFGGFVSVAYTPFNIKKTK